VSNPPTNPGRRRAGAILAWVRRHPRVSIAIYLALLALNWIALDEGDYGRRVWGERYMQTVGAEQVELSSPDLPIRNPPMKYWVATRGDIHDPDHPPALLLHGSPGAAYGFMASEEHPGLAGELETCGRATIWVDLPGFASEIDPHHRFKSYSADAYAQIMLAVLDELGVERAHLVGWSNGGAVALRMIQRDPDRAASLTMLASVGVEQVEGSGSYAFEHGKYAFGQLVLNVGGRLIPQFGLFGPPAETRAFLANFQDTDQRQLRPIMEHLDTPTLILHGRHDFLVPAWGAELHHRLMPTSRLVMLDASHFIPFMQAPQAAAIMEAHFERHDTPGVTPLTTYEDLCPNPTRRGLARLIEWVGEHVRWTPWWVLVPAIALLARWRPSLAAVLAGMYVGRVDLDLAVAFLGVYLGTLARARTPFDTRRLPLGWLTTATWSIGSIFLVFMLEQDTFPWHFGPDDAALRLGVVGFVVWVALGSLALHALAHVLRRRGRQRLLAELARLRRHEYWPAWAMYAPILPIWISRLRQPGGVLAFTAANPGIPCGGGFVGESKSHILRALRDRPEVLAHEPIDADGSPAERADRALRALADRPELAGLPCILKPDAGERGADVHLARTPDDVRRYFQRVPVASIVQRFHPGPAEFGVFWIRDPESVASLPGPDQLYGRVYSITRKVFGFVDGDGERTLGELILDHPRHRCQAGMFFRRFADRIGEVVPAGERVRLAQAGNHAQGTEFRDGSDLITPELERAIDDIASRFAGGLDYGRFDVRCADERALAHAEGLAIIEVNGVTSEATNHYDPDQSPAWAWGVLRGQWKRLYAVADARLASGGRALGVREFLVLLRGRRRATTVTD